MKDTIKSALEDLHTLRGKRVSLAINILIVLSLISFSMETMPDLSEDAERYLRYFEIFTVGLFTVEYLARVWVADQKAKFVFSFYGLIDLLAILPFYLALGMDLRSIRALRLLRLFRILKMGRYNPAIDRCRVALISIRDELVMFMALTVIMLYVAATGIYFFENQTQPEVFSSVFHSLWWAVTTLTTVGYGDTYPVTVGGRIFTFLVLMIGLGLVSIPSGLFASALTTTEKKSDAGTDGTTGEP